MKYIPYLKSNHLVSFIHCFAKSLCELFTYSSSSPEPPGRFQQNLAQSVHKRKGFKFVQKKDHALFLRGDNYEKAKII